MQRHPSLVLSALSALLFFGCAAATDGSPGTDDANRGPISKADRAGSCEDVCGGATPGGSCYCDDGCTQYGDCCNDYTAYCVDGSGPTTPTSVPEFGANLTTVADASDGLDVPRDIEFNPDRPSELWIANRAFDGHVIVFNPGQTNRRTEIRADAFGNHFMEEVSAFSFGDNGNFGTSQESRNTYNGLAPPNDFMGPSLWDADLSIYAKVNQNPAGPLGGSHIDMLHQSPLSMGITHHAGNAYWVFDGLHGDIVYYDFQKDHGPGRDDHSDGVVRRYVEASVARVADVPSHLDLDKASGWLYIADTGNGRILRLDTKTGAVDGSFQPRAEPLVEYSRVRGVTVQVFVATGLTAPSGIAFHGGRLFVSDYATGDIVAYDLNGKEIDRLATGARGLMGITFGPEGKLYFVDGRDDLAVRVDP